MLKKKLIIVGLMFIVKGAVAQLVYGVKVGLNHTNVVRTDLSWNFREYKQSFHLGGYVRLSFLEEKLITQAELLYSNKGFRNGPTDISEKSHTNLNYINMPILVGYRFLKRVNFMFGPEFGYLISAYGREGQTKFDANWFWDNKLDVGAVMGLSININPKLTIDLRYIHGLLSVVKDFFPPEGFEAGNEGRLVYLNRTFQLSLHYNIRQLGVK